VQLYEVIWKEQFADKIEAKHAVSMDEVEEVIFGRPVILKAGKGHIKGEDLYSAYGQTDDGRYLIVFFVRKRQIAAMPISARDMTPAERRYYERQKS
jgi:uncharacterized protein